MTVDSSAYAGIPMANLISFEGTRCMCVRFPILRESSLIGTRDAARRKMIELQELCLVQFKGVSSLRCDGGPPLVDAELKVLQEAQLTTAK